MTYAQDMLNFVVRKQLEKMLAWKVGALTDYSVSVGKSGKYMHRWLSGEEWQKYLDTYCSADAAEMWKAVEIMCRLFYDTSKWMAEKSGFPFDAQEADNSFRYFSAVREMNADASDICPF